MAFCWSQGLKEIHIHEKQKDSYDGVSLFIFSSFFSRPPVFIHPSKLPFCRANTNNGDRFTAGRRTSSHSPAALQRNTSGAYSVCKSALWRSSEMVFGVSSCSPVLRFEELRYCTRLIRTGSQTLLRSSPPCGCSGVLHSEEFFALSLLLLGSLSLMMSYWRQNRAITPAGRNGTTSEQQKFRNFEVSLTCKECLR